MKYIKYLFLIIYISLTIFIFIKASASAEESSNDSDKVTDVVVGTVDAITPGDESIVDIYGIDKIKQFIRKGLGHFGLFLALGVFALPTYLLFIKKGWLAVILELITGFMIAGISEIIQIYADSRGPAFSDVLLDFCGYLTSTILLGGLLIIIYIIRKKRILKSSK